MRAALVALALLAAGCGASRHPSDDELLRRFHAHRPELDQLVSMFQADRELGRVGDGFTRPEDPALIGVSPARIALYRQLCAAIQAPDCIEGYPELAHPSSAGPKDPIWIHVSSLGLAISGSSKGFCWSAGHGEEIVASLDTLRPRRSGTWLRPIEGNWYLYYDHED